MDLQLHPELKYHLEHLDFMLHATRKELDNSHVYAKQTHLHMSQQTEAMQMLAKDRKTLRQQRAKKDFTIARLRAKIASLEATVQAQETQLREMEEEGEDIQGGAAFMSDDDDFEEDENTDVEDYEFLEAGEDDFIPIDVDDE
jgi:chromosome segregation ATPase